MKRDIVQLLQKHSVQPSAQRVAVGEYVLETDQHPSADEVWARVKSRFPMVSRATIYNTLHLFVEKGLLRELILSEGRIVYDPHIDPHHHFIDEGTGAIFDVPWDDVEVCNVKALAARGLQVREYQVVMRGKRGKAAR